MLENKTQEFVYFPHVHHTFLPTNHYDLFEKSVLFFISWKSKIENHSVPQATHYVRRDKKGVLRKE